MNTTCTQVQGSLVLGFKLRLLFLPQLHSDRSSAHELGWVGSGRVESGRVELGQVRLG